MQRESPFVHEILLFRLTRVTGLMYTEQTFFSTKAIWYKHSSFSRGRSKHLANWARRVEQLVPYDWGWPLSRCKEVTLMPRCNGPLDLNAFPLTILQSNDEYGFKDCTTQRNGPRRNRENYTKTQRSDDPEKGVWHGRKTDCWSRKNKKVDPTRSEVAAWRWTSIWRYFGLQWILVLGQ